MTLGRRVNSAKAWWGRKLRGVAMRLLRLLTSSRGDLRQFVYLDEVALRSLMASRYGAEEVKTIEARSKGQESGWNTGLQVGDAKSVSASGGSSFRNSSSRTLEVERQPTVQSMFGGFLRREREQGTLVWDATVRDTAPETVKRGDLLQLRVRLAADPVYRIGAFISEFSDMAQSLPQVQRFDVNQLTQLSGVLERLMVGQVPIKAELVRAWAHQRDTRYKISSQEGDSPVALYVVASTDLSKYWTDTRRVLYGDQEFTVLVRVTVDGPTEEWSPIKLFDMMRKVAPDLSETLRDLESIISNVPVRKTADSAVITALSLALAHYAKLAEPDYDDPALAAHIDRVASAIAPDLPKASALNGAFDEIDRWLISNGKEGAAAEARRSARSTARTFASLDVLGRWAGPPPQVATGLLEEAFVEAEVIAIYW